MVLMRNGSGMRFMGVLQVAARCGWIGWLTRGVRRMAMLSSCAFVANRREDVVACSGPWSPGAVNSFARLVVMGFISWHLGIESPSCEEEGRGNRGNSPSFPLSRRRPPAIRGSAEGLSIDFSACSREWRPLGPISKKKEIFLQTGRAWAAAAQSGSSPAPRCNRQHHRSSRKRA